MGIVLGIQVKGNPPLRSRTFEAPAMQGDLGLGSPIPVLTGRDA